MGTRYCAQLIWAEDWGLASGRLLSSRGAGIPARCMTAARMGFTYVASQLHRWYLRPGQTPPAGVLPDPAHLIDSPHEWPS